MTQSQATHKTNLPCVCLCLCVCLGWQVLVDLGPAFVKIGQALSSRPDVLPPEYTTELELLQVRIRVAA